MSNRNNPRRGDKRRTEHGPRWENGDPGAGCNSTHVARARKKWKKRAARSERRTGKTSPKVGFRLTRRLLDFSEGKC
jgi:hypothetical protein